jgi:hypothetical protein
VDAVRRVEVADIETSGVTVDEVDLSGQPRCLGQRGSGVDVAVGDVDAEDGTTGGAGDLPRRPTETGTDIQGGQGRGEGEAGQQPVHGFGPAGVELVEDVELRPAERGERPSGQVLDRVDQVGFGIGHRAAPVCS